MDCANFVEYCKKYLGRPYIYGADGPDYFDCSGYVQFCLKHLNLDPRGDQTAMDLYRYFNNPTNGVIVDTPERGCLVFYGRANRVGHVVICINQEDMIEAGGGDQSTTTVEIAKKQGAEVRIRPIHRRLDIVDYIRPVGLPWV